MKKIIYIIISLLVYNNLLSQNLVTNGLYSLKKNELSKADSLFTLAIKEGKIDDPALSYYAGFAKKELFKKEREQNPKVLTSANRDLAIKYLYNALSNENKTYRESSQNSIQYLAQTLYNDAALTFKLDTLNSNDSLVKQAKHFFQQYIFHIESAFPFKDYSGQRTAFQLAAGSSYSKLWKNTLKEKYYEEAIYLYKSTLEIEPKNKSAIHNISKLKNKYIELLLEEEKILLEAETRKLDSSLAKLDVLSKEYAIEKRKLDLTKITLAHNKEKVDSILDSKRILSAEVEEQKNKLSNSEMALIANNDQLEKSNLQLINSKKDLSSTMVLLDNQKFINTAVIIIALIISLLLFFAVRNYLKQKKQNVIIELNRKEISEQHELLSEKNKEITDSIDYAKRIQSAILPPLKLVRESLADSFILYQPKDVISGDFYWLTPKANDGSTIFAAADCTGHGVPGAMVSVLCNSALNRSVKEFGLSEPGDILTKTRELVIEEFEKSDEEVKDGMDIALCSLKGNTLKYAGAYNPLWIIRKGSTEVEEIKAHKQAIGLVENATAFPTTSVDLNKGDSIYLFSDGFADQFGGEKGKKYKSLNFKRFLLSIQSISMVEQDKLLGDEFESWKRDLEQIDDVCVLGFRL